MHARTKLPMITIDITLRNPDSVGQKFRSPGGLSASGTVRPMDFWMPPLIVADTANTPVTIILEK